MAPHAGKRSRTTRTPALLIALLAIASCDGCDGCAEDLNHAAAFSWRTFADTDLPFADFDGGNYTIAGRFMLQYPDAYKAPLVAGSAGGFELAKVTGQRHLSLRVGGTTATYSQKALSKHVWHHFAVVHLNGLFFLYVDGQPICPDGFGGCNINAPGSAGSGTLRLGRTGAALATATESQYYGFLDDVAVFGTALSQSDVQALAGAPRLTGSETWLHAGWTFDEKTPSGGALPPELARPIDWRTGTPGSSAAAPFPHQTIVSLDRNAAHDAGFLPSPNHQTVLRLPFPSGEAWVVGQGWENTNISHAGRAAFAWDFNLAGQPASATNGEPFLAAAGGEIIEVNDGEACGAGWPANYVMVEQAPDEIGAYLHAVSGSIAVSTGQKVSTGTHLADTGDTGNTGCGNYHLHFALHNLPESQAGALVTIPGAFSDYQVSTDQGQTWSDVVKGIPKQGDWVRNPN